MARALAALGRGAERDALEREMARVEAAERARREEASVEDVRRRLESPDPRHGLLAYLDLSPALLAAASSRSRRARRGTTSLHASTFVAGGRGSHPHKVDAVIALSRARGLVAGVIPRGALTLLEAHAGLLDRCRRRGG